MKKLILQVLMLALQLTSATFIHAQCNLGNLSGMTGTFTACPGNSFQYTVGAVTNATSYTWNLPPGATINGQNPFTSAATTVTVDYDLTFTPPGNICVFANNSNCTVGPLCKLIVSQGVPSGASTISGNISACPGDLFTYSVTNTPGRTYAWTPPAGATISSGQGSSIVTVAFGAGFTSPGNLCVVVSNGCAVSAPRCLNIIQNIPPTPPAIAGPIIVCGGNSGIYTIATNPRATSYLWSVPPGATFTGQGTNTVNVTFPLGFVYGNVSVRYSNPCATSTPSALSVRSVPGTAQTMTGITAGLCGGSTAYITPLVAGATSYTWTVNNLASITSGQGTNNVIVNFPSNYNTGKVCVSPVNSCGTGTPRCLQLKKEIDILIQPVNDTSCFQTAMSFNADAMGINLVYQWRKNGVPLADGGNISGSQTQTLNISPADSSDLGSYDVTVNNGCASQKTSNTALLKFKHIPVVPSAISGGALVTCPGTTGVNYSVPAQADINIYDWSISDGGSIAAGQNTNSVTVDFGATINSGYYITLKVENECGAAIDSVTTWTRYSIASPFFTSGPDFVCPGASGFVYTIQNIVGADQYTWIMPPGATLVTGQNDTIITVDFDPGFTGGDITVNANNICYTTPNKIKTVGLDIPGQPGNISGQLYSTCNTTLTYSVAPVTGASSYTWILPTGATIVGPATNNSIDIQFTNPGNSSQLCVTANSTCLSGIQRCTPLRARPEALSVITANPAAFCANQAGVQFSVSAPPVPSTIITWAATKGTATVTGGQNSTTMTATMGNVNGNILVTPSNTCSGGSTRTFPVNFTCRKANGSIEETNTVLNDVQVYPSPANEFVMVKFQSENSSPFTVELIDLLGKSVLSYSGTCNEGINENKLDLTNVSSGVYTVSVKTNSTTKFIKLKVN
ncbi:MAG TPA: T9SS type A sorting domain-containing protein [Bacteroidia bacterium]|nr:T9SS type A sorting domain-containing protein [Bacteroidia bacterium]HNU34239.1 T9SS type A sorting domain-containing protein [Bacteroidia bacterium]